MLWPYKKTEKGHFANGSSAPVCWRTFRGGQKRESCSNLNKSWRSCGPALRQLTCRLMTLLILFFQASAKELPRSKEPLLQQKCFCNLPHLSLQTTGSLSCEPVLECSLAAVSPFIDRCVCPPQSGPISSMECRWTPDGWMKIKLAIINAVLKWQSTMPLSVCHAF